MADLSMVPVQPGKTLEAIRQQVQAFGCERFEIGVRNERTGQMQNRGPWNEKEIEHAVNWLKRENALGHHIYIRPAELDPAHAPAIVLVDDLKKEAVQEMRRDGYEPSLVLETSPGNYQAWVRVREKEATPLSRDEANETARSLAHHYQGDLNSADCRHYGRLAGFTNQKEKYTREDGKKPFVKLIEAVQRVATKGAELLERVREYLVEREKTRRVEHIKTYRLPQGRELFRQRTPAEEYQYEAKKILEKPPLNQDNTVDYSRVDYRVAGRLLEQGYDKEQTKQALREASPHLADRKVAHLEDYLERTVNKAQEELTRKLSLARGFVRSLER